MRSEGVRGTHCPEENRKAEENSDKNMADRAVQAFVAEIKADRIELAYELTTDDFRKRVSIEDFQKLCKPFNEQRNKLVSMKVDFFAASTGKLYSFESFGSFDTVIKMTAVEKDGKWLIDRFTVSNKP